MVLYLRRRGFCFKVRLASVKYFGFVTVKGRRGVWREVVFVFVGLLYVVIL